MINCTDHREIELTELHQQRAVEKICGPVPQKQWEKPYQESSVVKAVKSDVDGREGKGVRTYGTTLDTANLSRQQRLQHLYEELLDAVLYLKHEMMQDDATH